MSKSSVNSLLLRDVIDAVEEIIPPELAESWDNVCLLLESPSSATKPIERVLLTNDLTEDVLAEAIENKSDIILSYHPTPFGGLKKITSATREGRVVIGCLSNHISVYSSHTAADSVHGGVCDWLAAGLGPGSAVPVHPNVKLENAGAGRIVTLDESVSLGVLIDRLKVYLGLPHLRLGLAKRFLTPGVSKADRQRAALNDSTVKTVALCPGSGAGVLKVRVLIL